MVIFQLLFAVQRTDGSPTGSDPENSAGDQDIRSPGTPVCYELQMPGEPGHFRTRTRTNW
jgi:hypothetical protein